jgi:hypothetical protein
MALRKLLILRCLAQRGLEGRTEDVAVPLDRASAAIDQAERFIDRIAELLA